MSDVSRSTPETVAGPKFSDEEAVRFLNASFPPGLKLMNADCVSASNADASLTISYDLDERFNNAAGFVCGGYVANALDQAMGYAMSFVTGDPAPTLEMKISFIAAARPGRLSATGKVLKAGKTIGFVEGVLHDERGNLLATASATVQQIAMNKLTGKA